MMVDVARCTNTFPQYTIEHDFDKATIEDLDRQPRERCGFVLETSFRDYKFCPRCDAGTERHGYTFGMQAFTEYLYARANWIPPQ
jgi:hypothetical protein